MAGSADPNARRIIASGLRNPFRITARPGTDEVWVGDVGWGTWEEINRITDTVAPDVVNFGWPCYEGAARQSGYDAADLNICENLYAAGPGAVVAPHFAYHHSNRVVANETCPTGSSSIAGLDFEFASGVDYPPEYEGALFFADYSRDCIWVMPKGLDGQPAPGLVRTFVAGAANPVNLEFGPDGHLYYVDFDGGTIRRIEYFDANQPPTARITAQPLTGSAPLTVTLDGSGSSDPDPGDTLTFAWDLDADGAHDDAVGPQATATYGVGSHTISLRVTDPGGLSDTDTVTVTVGNTPPDARITAPAAGVLWEVGDVITFAGAATDVQDGTLGAAAMTWSLVLHHCPSNCHQHQLQTFAGVSGGSFTAPDHEYPSYLELQLTATDSGGLSSTASLRLDPRTVVLTFQTTPGGMQLIVDGAAGTSSFTRTVIVGSAHTISAPSPQRKGPKDYLFNSWSDGGAATHTIVAPATATTYTARYRAR
jgi:PKD repeat protein